MPLVKIYLWKGRDKEKKKELIKKVTSAVVDVIDCSAEAVQVIINEVDKDNWGIGGVPASIKFPDR
ncbi:4-oxalocrotonate tautomerase [Candidatus Aerophobetes bacterium Ae_b3a]|nr:MAG: 4-oxalocrotonate tautomerase [Candidatus Aerophobetes bacterium Ae_b3a]